VLERALDVGCLPMLLGARDARAPG
jgi:hypothetical protein